MLELIKNATASLGIVGHAGCGHANSHLGFIQDDSGGLTAVVRLLQRATKLDLEISEVIVKTGKNNAFFEVHTKSGGIGKAFARRGITRFEERLAQYAVGRQAINSQALATEAFGRILGQGAMEVPVAFQTAIANASMDSFSKNFPDFFKLVDEEIEGNCGKILGTQLCIDGVNVSVLALSNASIGGIGPNEDIEGNVNLYEKGKLMAELGLDSLPSYVIEGKVCAQPFSAEISEPTFLIRAFPDHDNPIIARSLEKSAQKLNYPAAYKADLLSRSDNALRNLTQEQGEYIQELGRKISGSTTAVEKVRLAAELNRFASEDLGGITFMSEDVHRVMGGVGCIPGTSCVLSLFIPNLQLEEDVIPTLTIDDADRYVNLIIEGISFLRNHTEEALLHMNKVKSVFGI